MIIGFAGKAASGKTTAAMHLAPLLQGEALIIPMAMVLREEVEEFLRACGAAAHVPLVYGSQEDKLRVFHLDEQLALQNCSRWEEFIRAHQEIQDRPGLTSLNVRRILQWWGTEYRRAQDPDYWTQAWEHKVGQLDLARTHVLVDDIRFRNELNSLSFFGGLIVKIERPGFAAGGNHASEISLDDFDGWDRVIINDGSLEEFQAKVAELVALQ